MPPLSVPDRLRQAHPSLLPALREGDTTAIEAALNVQAASAEVKIAPVNLLRLAEAEARLGEELVEEKWAQVSGALGSLRSTAASSAFGERLDLLARLPLSVRASREQDAKLRRPGFRADESLLCAIARSAFTGASLGLIVFRLTAFRSRPVAATWAA